MGFGDKLKGLRDQAQQAVAENKDKLQGAVQVVGEAANNKTHGKYAGKIAQVGERVSGKIDQVAEGAGEEPETSPARPAEPTEGTPSAAAEPAPSADTPPAASDAPAPGFPEFE